MVGARAAMHPRQECSWRSCMAAQPFSERIARGLYGGHAALFLPGVSIPASGLLGGKEVDEYRQDDAEQAVERAACDEGVDGGCEAEEHGNQRLSGIFLAVAECVVVRPDRLFKAFPADDATAPFLILIDERFFFRDLTPANRTFQHVNPFLFRIDSLPG